MKAIQYTRIGAEPELTEIPKPEPGPGEVLLEVTAAGVCHSDDFIMSLPEEQYTYGLPLTLGHEGAGKVAAVGIGLRHEHRIGRAFGGRHFVCFDQRGPRHAAGIGKARYAREADIVG